MNESETTCKWCSYPESTHRIKAPGASHDFEVNDCEDKWHGEIHGWDVPPCPSCAMIVIYRPMFMGCAIIPGKAYNDAG